MRDGRVTRSMRPGAVILACTLRAALCALRSARRLTKKPARYIDIYRYTDSINLATRDLHASVAFYSTLLDARPAKTLSDYALFVTEEPALEFALDFDAGAQAALGQHFGIVVDSSDVVDAQIERLQAAGYAVDVEREETCCYANQTKVWASDPEGRRWETYVVHADTETRDAADALCCDATPC